MIVVLQENATPEQVREVQERLREVGYGTHLSRGEEKTLIGAVGEAPPQKEALMASLETLPRLEPVWLPTYAPWLNPIEKLWRWLKETIIKMHRLASDWPALHQRVNDFLQQFVRGSRTLLRYVGLLGEGQLAQALHFP